jgi:hypothetical protein
MNRFFVISAVAVSLLLAVFFVVIYPSVAGEEEASIKQTFSRYARYGADVWAQNPAARISGEGTACVSCHTSLPFALVEPLLPGSYTAYDDLIDNVDNRILTWSENTPWYSEKKLEDTAALSNTPPETLIDLLDAEDSRGVEAVFNAFIRSMHDAYSQTPAGPETRQAFTNMWSEQILEGPEAGRWHWIQVDLIPWEVADSDLWGASLAGVAAAIYPELAPPSNLELLYAKIRKAATDEGVSMHVKSAILWCDAETGGKVLDDDVATQIAADLLRLQHENGAWALRDLGPWPGWEGSRADCCPEIETRPDAYATGVVTLALTRHSSLLSEEGKRNLDDAIRWIEGQLAKPYPAEPRYNRHDSADADMPEFRNSLYTNAGHTWAYLARAVHAEQAAPWVKE